jgi:hypothetical protein
MRQRLVCVCLVFLTSVTLAAQTRAGYLLFTDPGMRFSIEFPRDWRWMIISGSGEPIATFIQPRSEAAVVVERFRLKQPLRPDDITDLFAEIEVEYLKENQRGVASVSAKVIARDGMRASVVDYSRPGLNEEERVRMYSFPVGEDLYRVTCMSVTSRFQKYEPEFENIVSTLKSAEKLKQ